jgi:hypothetical protein
MEHYLGRKSYFQCDEPVRTVIAGMEIYLELLKQSYGDLNETRTAELQLQELVQTGTVPEYLTRFIQYALRVTWHIRAKMAQFYKGFNSRIKDAMVLRFFSSTWESLIDTASQLDDNFRRRAQEKKGQNPEQRFKQNLRKSRYPDKIEWTASTAVKRNANRKFQKQGLKRKGKCYNCGKEGHFAAECRSVNEASFSEKPRKSKKNKGKGKQRKEKVYELRGEKKERDESLSGGPVYFHLLRGEARDKGRKGPGPGNLTFFDSPPPFRITENLSGTAQNFENPSEECCINSVYQV